MAFSIGSLCRRGKLVIRRGAHCCPADALLVAAPHQWEFGSAMPAPVAIIDTLYI